MAIKKVYKLTWIGLVLAFLGVETYAILDPDTGDTFSEFVWWLIGTDESERDGLRWAARIGLGGLFAWLIPHFFTGWKWFKGGRK